MDERARFVPARELARQLARAVEAALHTRLPDVPLTLGLLGPGSDVLGYDSARSMDHDWGLRLTVVVSDAHADRVRDALERNLDTILPTEIQGFPTHFSRHEDGTLFADPGGPFHRVHVTTLPELLQRYLSLTSIDEVDTDIWLSTPMQNLLELTSGEIFLDEIRELAELRSMLAFYPDDVWRYQLAALWMRVSQVQPFVGRALEAGDSVGSLVITAGIVRDLMRISLLQSRRYAPYAKWLGTAVARTKIGDRLLFHCEVALEAQTSSGREEGLNAAGALLIQQLNDLEMIPRMRALPAQFHARPYMVMPAEEIAHALQKSLAGTACERLPAFVGGIDLVTDSTDALKSRSFREAFRQSLRSGPPR